MFPPTFDTASLSASEAAILNANSEESTSWYDPSYNVTLISTIGYPATTPVSIASCNPFSTAGINSLGMVPPLISSANTNPPPLSIGSTFIFTWPYCPLPPVCLTNLCSTSALARIVSLYATWGFPILASTLNSLLSLSTIISRWSSPIPEIMVWPVSSSYLTLNDGSSAASLLSEIPSFSWSDLVFGSMAIDITGSGNLRLSSMILFFSSHNVSPVAVLFSPTAAAISPATTSVTSSLLLACILSSLPILSLLSLDEL